jgi:very-short-patch-repair endonuclease
MTSRRTTTARRLRTTMLHTEWRVWERVRGRKLDGWKFRRQHPIGPYFVDLYCPAAGLVVEINGPTHYSDGEQAYDKRRTAWLGANGYRVLQFGVNDVDEDLDSVIDTIHRELLAVGIPANRFRPDRRVIELEDRERDLVVQVHPAAGWNDPPFLPIDEATRRELRELGIETSGWRDPLRGA